MKNIKSLILIAALFLLIIPFLRLGSELSFLPKNLQKQDILKADLQIPEIEKQALFFMALHMSGPQLSIYTNYLNANSYKDTIASGEDILSESQGLFLLYLLNRDKKDYFDLCLHWTVNNLYMDNGMFSWVKRKTSKSEKINALIDDLRIVRALISAYEKWGDERYLKLAKKAAGAIKKYNTQGLIPLDFYDIATKYKANCITVSYLDLYTMKNLAVFDSRWKDIYSNSCEVIKKAKIEGTGLYKFQYDLDKKAYMVDEEISLIQSVYAMLHLEEVGQSDKQGIEWIWNQYKKHSKLYAAYSSKTFEPVSDIESTALYALTARLLYLSGDIKRAETLLKECEKFRVYKKDSEIYGSFGNDVSMEVNSFDNLQYILSSSMIFLNK